MIKLKDDSIMPFGKYKGVKMANVPGSYLLWIFDNTREAPTKMSAVNRSVYEYIKDNKEVLEKEVKK